MSDSFHFTPAAYGDDSSPFDRQTKHSLQSIERYITGLKCEAVAELAEHVRTAKSDSAAASGTIKATQKLITMHKKNTSLTNVPELMFRNRLSSHSIEDLPGQRLPPTRRPTEAAIASKTVIRACE